MRCKRLVLYRFFKVNLHYILQAIIIVLLTAILLNLKKIVKWFAPFAIVFFFLALFRASFFKLAEGPYIYYQKQYLKALFGRMDESDV